MSFSALINNTWVVGIVGGILSGLVTYWIIQKLFSGKTKKEYSKNVEATNREIVYSLRSAISDNVHHEQKVIEGLISSTARKNGVLVKDVYSIKQIAEDLIKEVMDSSFIPSTYKKEYCDNLMKLYLSKSITDQPNINGNEGITKQTSRIDESIMTSVSLLFGIMAAGSTMFLTLIESRGSLYNQFFTGILFGAEGLLNKAINILLPIFLALTSLSIVFIVQHFIRKDKQRNIKVMQIINQPKDKYNVPPDGDTDKKD